MKIELLRLDGGTQPRELLSFDTVVEYAEAFKRGDSFPPVVAFYDGEEYWLADGFHRVNGAQEAGLDEIDVDVKQGTREDAVWFSLGANQSHGLPRTNLDKRRVVTAALQHPKSKGMSDRSIAEHVGVSNQFVANIRSETQVSTVDTSTRRGKDGKNYKPSSKTRSESAKNRKPKQPAPESEPEADSDDNNVETPADSTSAAPSPPAPTRMPSRNDDAAYDTVAALALRLVELASALTVQQQDSIVRLVSHRIGTRKAA